MMKHKILVLVLLIGAAVSITLVRSSGAKALPQVSPETEKMAVGVIRRYLDAVYRRDRRELGAVCAFPGAETAAQAREAAIGKTTSGTFESFGVDMENGNPDRLIVFGRFPTESMLRAVLVKQPQGEYKITSIAF